jgi:hypothetical protein
MMDGGTVWLADRRIDHWNSGWLSRTIYIRVYRFINSFGLQVDLLTAKRGIYSCIFLIEEA